MGRLSGPLDDVTGDAGYGSEPGDHPPRMGFFTDTSVCIGCKACEVACKEWNAVPDDGYLLTGMSYDNTQELGASTWRHVAFVEKSSPSSVSVDLGMPGAGPPGVTLPHGEDQTAASGDGTVTWRFERDHWTYSSPGVTRDGIAYFGDHASQIRGLDATTGRVLFSFDHTGSGIWTSILVDAQHTVYAGTRAGLIYAVDRDGHLLWSLPTGSTVDSYPALTADGALVIGTSGGELLAIADH